MVLVNYKVLPVNTEGFALSEAFGKPPTKQRTINNSIGIMLRSYTNAINKQQNSSGALFRRKSKAKCINCPNSITPSFITENSITKIKLQNPEEQYPQICFDYIHQNPIKAKLVKNVSDWQFSSSRDYARLRNGRLINKKVTFRFVNTSFK
ncbi:MAG: hypothetical protein DRJ01_10635 [Bacteroidetes bacterium]|nr:MAG: hypothetical protein DRJ01_10635 [Bacteroidota bacterium]